MFDLTGKKAIVTGASGGIGREIAKALAGAGAEVVLSGRRLEALQATADEIDGKTHIIACDLANLEQVDALVPQAVEAMGGLDILVNNAGLASDNVMVRMKDEQWDEVIAVNLTAAFHLSRAAVKAMLKQRYGRIIGIGSVVGVAGNMGQANYAASKAGLMGMTKSLAEEVATRNITVNVVAPGFVASDMTHDLTDKQRDQILVKVPANRLGTTVEVAACVLFLASEEAGYVTGHTLNVNGGGEMI